MTIHHLNCGSIRPYWPRLRAIVYCLLIETSEGLVLVDTGFGLGDCARPVPLVRFMAALLRVPRDPEEAAVRQVARLGFLPQDVRHVVQTHLHFDHAGGLPDFSGAQVHVLRAEYEAAMVRRGLWARFYLPAHWAHGPQWVIHEAARETWFGLPAIPILENLSPCILLVPLPGHTAGHCGVAVETGEGWLFHCGDAASAFHPAADPNRPAGPPPNRWIRRLIGRHVATLRRLKREHGDEVRLISGHDRHSFLAQGGWTAEAVTASDHVKGASLATHPHR